MFSGLSSTAALLNRHESSPYFVFWLSNTLSQSHMQELQSPCRLSSAIPDTLTLGLYENWSSTYIKLCFPSFSVPGCFLGELSLSHNRKSFWGRVRWRRDWLLKRHHLQGRWEVARFSDWCFSDPVIKQWGVVKLSHSLLSCGYHTAPLYS